VTGGSDAHQSTESKGEEPVETDEGKDAETGQREIMLVIVGGEGYVDFRRGTQLSSFTLYILVKNISCLSLAIVYNVFCSIY